MNKELRQSHAAELRQTQRLILSPQMQQSLHLLQLPILELSTVISNELEQNPLLEYEPDDFPLPSTFRDSSRGSDREEEDLRVFIENTVASERSLFHCLMDQASDTFSTPEEMQLAEALIGNLDEKGFFSSSLEEIAAFYGTDSTCLLPILKKIQTFDPPGVAARDVRESFLLQLSAQGKEKTLGFVLIDQHFDALIHNRLPLIAKATRTSVEHIRAVIEEEISHLTLHPGAGEPQGHYRPLASTIIPDVSIIQRGEELLVEVNEQHIPSFRINWHYLRLLEDPSLNEEARSYLKSKVASGKSLLKNIQERHHTLHRITEELLHKQLPFFSTPTGTLLPLTMKEIAEAIGLHESTVVRAVANKYLYCSRGLFSLRTLFTHAYMTETGEMVSATTVKNMLQEILQRENRSCPLSDEKLSSLLSEKGIPCARRTVAKYRQELGFGTVSQRKIH